MPALAAMVALVCAGVVVTFVGSRLIERRHPPRGRFIAIDGLRQHVLELGNRAGAPAGPAVVLLHGAGCNLEDLRMALGEQLAARHRVILVDRPGLGWSERSGRQGSSPASQAEILRDLLDRLAVERAIVVGHSWGATLAITFALDHPQRVAGLVLLAPPTHPRLHGMTRLYAVLATPFLGWLFAHTLALPLSAAALGPGVRGAFRPQAPPHRYLRRSAAFLLLRPRAFLANARDVAGLQGFLAQQATRYGALKAPTVIVSGDCDRVLSPQHHAVAFADSVPQATLIALPGVGHMPHHAAAGRIIAAIEALAANSA
jgi:pimeloyl-ACP methyl ester carboxylesterase